MRIAYVCQSYPPMLSGAAIVVEQLAEGMSASDHSVTVVSASDKGHPYSSSQNSIKITRFRSFSNPTRVGQNVSLWPYRKISSEIKRFRPDIIHFHDPVLSAMSNLLLTEIIDVPSVVTIHQLPWTVGTFLPKSLHKAAETSLWLYGSWALKQSKAVITPNQTIANLINEKIQIQPDVINNGVDLDLFTPEPNFPNEGQSLRQKYGLDPDLPIILYVGRLDADKRVDRVIDAAAKVFKSIDAQLLIIGDGTQRQAAILKAENLGISHRAHLPGFVQADADLPGLYRLASVFVTASEIELHSLSMLEAEASELPIVAFHSPGVRDQVSEGESGYLVPPGDIDAMSDRIAYLLKNPERAQLMGEKSRLLAERYSLQHFISSHEQYYQQILN
jgi:glycosyltransferase involved in cell wall biosynthesis